MMAFARLVDRGLGVCERLFLVLANTCLAVTLVINMMNIASRAVFDKGIGWVFPWSVVLFVWMTFFGFFVLYRMRRDITVDFLVDRIGPSARFATRLLVNFIILVLMAIMLWHGPQILASQAGEIEMVGLERYTMSIPLFLSCILISVTFILDTVFALMGEPELTSDHVGDD